MRVLLIEDEPTTARAIELMLTTEGFNVYSTDLGDTANLGDADGKDVYNLSGTYNNGPLYLGLAYGDGDGHEAIGVGSHWRVAGGFTFGNAKIVGQYDSLEDDNSVDATKQNGDYDAWMDRRHGLQPVQAHHRLRPVCVR